MLNRRHLLSLVGLGGVGAIAATELVAAQPTPVSTNARIVIIGAGAAGTALANVLVRRLEGADITVIDPQRDHLYQPGLTLIAAGLRPPSYVVSRITDWLPSGISLVEAAVAAVDPVAKTVETTTNETIAYDFLVVAPGVVLDHDAIEGFSLDMVGRDGIGALYAGPNYAERTWLAASRFAETGGVGVFTRPGTKMKCGGAPLKHAFLIDDIARRAGNAARTDIFYAAHNDALFGVPIVAERVRMLFEERGIGALYSHVLKAVDAGRRIATFRTPTGDQEIRYDYLHVVPPQRAPDFVPQSDLSWQDRWVDEGWVEADPQTLRHRRYPDIFALGDVAGVPKGKTAASVKWQLPVVVNHLTSMIRGQEGSERYNGYTSCPLTTRIGRAMLIEFDYDNNLTPSFPGIIAPLEELWISWLIKEVAVKATYQAMLRGRA